MRNKSFGMSRRCCLWLAAAVLFINFQVESPAQSPINKTASDEINITLKSPNNELINILQLTDLHLGDQGKWKDDMNTFRRIRRLVEMYDPDLLALTGDVFSGEAMADSVIRHFDELRRPWVYVFGNHDAEGNFDRDDIYQAFSDSEWGVLGYHEDSSAAGRKYDYCVNINLEGDSIPKWQIYGFDTGPHEGVKAIQPGQITWYKTKSRESRELYGTMPRAISLFHIPFIQYQYLWDDKTLPKKGESREKVCYEKDDGSCYEAFVELGNIEATFCGHDHYNNYWGEYTGGIILSYGYISGEATNEAWPTGGKLISLAPDQGEIEIQNVVPVFDGERSGRMEQLLAKFHDAHSDYVMVAAHRAAHKTHPENSISAIKRAIELGVDIVELDVKTSKDGIPVLMHDETVDRTTNGSGRVEDLSLSELKALSLKMPDGTLTGEKIPTFEEALKVIHGNIMADIDLKTDNVHSIVEAVKRTGTEAQVFYFDSDYEVLQKIMDLEENSMIMPRAYSYEMADSALKRFAPQVVHIDPSFYTPEVSELIGSHNARIWINALGMPDAKIRKGDAEKAVEKLLQYNANIIQTDEPEILLKYLRSKGLNAQCHHEDLTSYVDPFIGTGGHGHTFPGAVLPFGMVQISPDTRMENWDGSSGYHYSDSTIMGFSQTHLSGTGAPEFCDVLLMPTVGKVRMIAGDEKDPGTGYRSSFSHQRESASPGYYSVQLDDYQVHVELTATPRSGFHQYSFPASDSSNIIVDLLNRDRVLESNIQVLNDTVITGFRRSIRWAKDQHVYFYAVFSKPFEKYGIAVNDTLVEGISQAEGKNIKAFVSYHTRQDEKIMVKTGISAVSVDGAKMNLEAENRGWDFDDVHKQAKRAWNKHLSKIEIEGGSEREKRIFYTSLYHTAMAPIVFNDVDGHYRGVDLKVHKADGFTRYSVFSLWDVFRAQMPLYTILEPGRMNDFIQTFLAAYENGGRLPHWEIWGNYSGSMIGHHSLPVILDAYNKGIRNYDIDLACEAMKNQVDHDGYYARMGFIPADKRSGSVSKCMEYSYNDWCIAALAKDLGKEDDFLIYQQRAQFYRNLFDPGTGFMRPKNSDRSWVEPFDPAEGSEHFVEGNAYQYSLFAPHDVNGLITLLGGDGEFEKWLDRLFTQQSEYDAEVVDASGLIGQYAHGNEPSHHMAYLYNYVGAAPKTQKMIRTILSSMYDDTPAGLEGNEDCGQMSAWYILSSMGFYPVNPGDAKYIIGSPLFERLTVHLENGKDFIIEARDVSDQNKFIQSATLNCLPLTKSWFRHEDIRMGGRLVFTMGPDPNRDWGTSLEDRPASMEFMPAVALPYVLQRDHNFMDSMEISLLCDTEDAAIYFTLDGTEPHEGSQAYTAPFVLENTSRIKFTAIKEGLQKSLTVTETFNKLAYETFQNYEGSRMEQGLNYRYYEGDVMFVRELSALKPVEKGIISHFSIANRNTDMYFGYEFEGFIRIPEDGAYTFYNKSNDGSILYLDGKEFINMDGGHPAHETFRTISLKKGTYRIAQKYFQMGGEFMNRVSWKGPGFEKTEIPAQVLLHQTGMPDRGISTH